MKYAIVLATSALLGLAACGGASSQNVPDVASAERLLGAPQAASAAPLAPTFVAEAKLELSLAKKALADGDDITAALHAQRSIAATQRAYVVARLARAEKDEADAKGSLTEHETKLKGIRDERAKVDAEVDALEKKLRVAREASLPSESGGAGDAGRAQARLRAAETLLAEGRLLCAAARLLDPQAKGLAEAEAGIADAEGLLGGKGSKVPTASGKPRQPIDGAAVARVACLSALSGTRRAATTSDDPDVLFAELSAQSAQKSPPAPGPSRDERGVVLTLRDVFRGTDLTDAGKQALAQAALVARAHPNVAIQLVVHEAEPGATATSDKRGASALQALEAGGVARARLRADSAGTNIAVVASGDPSKRARNARLDVVFVTR